MPWVPVVLHLRADIRNKVVEMSLSTLYKIDSPYLIIAGRTGIQCMPVWCVLIQLIVDIVLYIPQYAEIGIEGG